MTVREWLDQVALDVGPVEGATAVAEELVALAHDCRDRTVWGGDRVLTYWDRLPEKIRVACYAGPTLAAWWERIGRMLGAGQPRSDADRRLLARALACGWDADVLTVLRSQPQALVLRVRLAQQVRRDQHDETRLVAEPVTLDTYDQPEGDTA